MKKRNIIIVTILIIAISVITSILFLKYQNQKSQTILNLTTEDKYEDFDALCNILDDSYPFWNEVSQAGIDKDAIYATYLARLERADTDIKYFKEIKYFLNEFKGFGHLSVLDGYMYRLYADTLTESSRILTEKEAQSIASLVDVLTNSISQNTYSLLDQSHTGFRSTIGLKEEYLNEKTADTSVGTSELMTKILEDGKTAYLKIPSFLLTNYQSDKAVLAKFFTEINELSNLIIDLRGNSGGSDLYWKDLIVKPNANEAYLSERYYLFNRKNTTRAHIAANVESMEPLESEQNLLLSKFVDKFSHFTVDQIAFEPSPSPYKGNIWVLVDDDVYSASENFAVFCKNTGFATLVGTTTGGDGGIADPILVSLPKSGLIVRFSVFYGLNADGTGNEANGTTPDVIVSKDEDALDKCLSLLD